MIFFVLFLGLLALLGAGALIFLILIPVLIWLFTTGLAIIVGALAFAAMAWLFLSLCEGIA